MDESILRLYYDKNEDRYFFISVYRSTHSQGITYNRIDKLTVCEEGVYSETAGSQEIYWFLNDSDFIYSRGIVIDNKRVRAPELLGGENAIAEAGALFINEAENYLSGYELIREYDIKSACDELYDDLSSGNSVKLVDLDKEYSDYPAKKQFNRTFPENDMEFVYINGVRHDINSFRADVIINKDYHTIDFETLYKMPNLTALSVRGESEDEAVFVDLSGLAGIKNLKSLSLDGGYNDKNLLRFDSEELARLTGLEEFSMDSIGAELDFISGLTNLRSVEIKHCSHPETDYFAPLYGLANLEIMLHNDYDSSVVQEQCEAIKENMPRLEHAHYMRY